MKEMLLVEIILLIILLLVIILAMRNVIVDAKINRIGFYSLSPKNKKQISLSERIINKYYEFLKKNRKILKKSKYLTIKARRYEKYIKFKDKDKIIAIDFITNKIAIMILFIILTFVSLFITGRYFSYFNYFINLILGYYLLDICLFVYYKRKTKNMDNDLLRAIIIMNNAFKAGKSTLQAIKIASDELNYPLNDEFKRMYFDMKFGLQVDNVFERFAKRVDVEAATYVATSLTILSKTGGNITNVFSSIERTLFDKKKLDEEMKNISANPKMVIRILGLIPFIFILVVYILNPNYFNPLFNSVLGYMIVGIIIIMFILYLVMLKKVLKVE